jgi:hypothetical protein|tara:strand:+ start:2006 stop:2602 length:597 start_codon:yes stop_codon:yes gene_type:complete
MSLKTTTLHTQQDLLLDSLKDFYTNTENLKKIIDIVNGESNISLRIVDWFVTNYAKKYFTVFEIPMLFGTKEENVRFKVYNEYKLKLKAYSKKRFDPFCRWDRIDIPYNDNMYMETTIGQLNFFKWALQHKVIDYIEQHYKHIEQDMNNRNSTSKRKDSIDETKHNDKSKTRKKREELSISACKCIKKESVKIIVKFN